MQLANVLGMALGTGLGGSLLTLTAAAGHSTAVGIATVDALALAAGVLGLLAARGLSETRSPSLRAESS
jgi:hypothetical protein